jgi:hypothetical protein
MASQRKRRGPEDGSQVIRFEATLGSANHAKALAAAASLALDRLPDVQRKVRLLITADDARRLLERGFEVHLHTAAVLAPLDRRLILSDRQAQEELEARLKGVRRKGGR